MSGWEFILKQDLLAKLLKIAAVFIVIRIVVQLIYIIVDHFFKVTKENDNIKVDENLLQNLRALLKTVLVYGGYFLAAILALEILQLNFLEARELKDYGLKLLRAVLIVIGARLGLKLGWAVIDHLFLKQEEVNLLAKHRRAGTLRALLRSCLMYVVYFIAGVMVLESFNVNTSSILAGAGIVGLAVGFGAQNLVRDIITGFFIIFEDQFTVGEYITTAGVTGVVEELGLRTTKIREWTGQLHIIPNGEITKVTNFNRGQMLAVVDVRIAYEANLDHAIEVLRRASENAAKELQGIVETPVVQGVVALRDSDVLVRVIARTLAGEQWAVERELRKRLKEALDESNVEIPYPKRVVYSETGRQSSGSN